MIRKKRIELYIDGKLAATANTPSWLRSECGQGMQIGFDLGNSPAEITDHFKGCIDEVKFFTTGLTAREIAKQMRQSPFAIAESP